jgi:hypothetical protein
MWMAEEALARMAIALAGELASLESLHRQPPPSTAAEIQVALIENYLLT